MSISHNNLSVGLDEINSVYEAQFTLIMSWYDKRLVFNNLNSLTEKNSLSKNEREKLWFPKVVFENTNDKLQTVMDDITTTNIKSFNITSFKFADKTVHEAVKQYSGKENLLIMSKFYNIRFHCEFQMQWYPFDLQVCQVIFGSQKDQLKFVYLESEAVEYIGSTDLTQYYLRGIDQKTKRIRGIQHVVVELMLGRRLLSMILTVFTPTVLLNLIGHSSNYFKPFFFESVISLNVTVMLVLTTMFISVSNNLPKTAHIKMIDIWLIFNLLKPFVDIMIQTYIESLRVADEINHHGTALNVEDKQEGKDDDRRNSKIRIIPVDDIK